LENIPEGIEAMVTDYVAGKLPKGTELVGLDTQSFVLCPHYDTAANQGIVTTIEHKLADGQLKLPTSLTDNG
jgi:hypothetical protein